MRQVCSRINSNIINVIENVLEACLADFHELKRALEKWSD